ncbi:hypothetical protein MMC27_008044 [Xylographa pallens]|nr:hypothetical protein [Xylographa pallens]
METNRSRDRAFKKPRYEDWPRVVDENYKRAADENGHHAQERITFDDFHLSSTSQLPTLSLRECHQFCWKECVLYSTANLHCGSSLDLFYYVYNTWFQGDASNVDFQAFFCKLVCCWSEHSPKDVPVLIQTHRSLYNQLARRQNGLDMQEASSYKFGDEFADHASYKLMQFFGGLFVVLDSIFWYEEGVLLVSSDRSKLSETGFGSGLSFSDLPEFHENDRGRVIRVSLRDAIMVMRQMNEEEHAQMINQSTSSSTNNDGGAAT